MWVTGNLDKAQQTYELWAQAYPRTMVPHAFLSGTSSIARGNHQKSVDEAKIALGLDPEVAIIHSNLARREVALERIPADQHLGQDEIVLIQKGTAHVQVGGQERDLHAGGLVFIPAYTWVSLKNDSNEQVSIVGIFSSPGFENHLRCVSVRSNEKATPLSPDEKKQCDHEGHVVYKELGQNSEK
jgi:hypothetical protein